MRFKLAVSFFSLVLSALSYATDGVLEINQACAENGGCFPGDSAGFPVTITQPGSYRLTSRLDLSGIAPVTAVQVSASAVHLNLGGFEIVGPTTCTGSGGSIDCNPSGTGQGVEFFTASIASSVRNGTVRGFGDSGIAANPEGIRISDITAIHNSNDGIAGVRSALIENCVAMENGGDGFDSDASSVLRDLIAIGNGNHGIEIDNVGGVVSGSTSKSNGGSGFNIAALSKFGHDNESWGNLSEDNCGGGICTPKRRYYLTELLHDGASALSACDDGFHMAAMYEIHDLGGVQYDHILGHSRDDSGSGPPTDANHKSETRGWARSGGDTHISVNCVNWTSATEYGAIIGLYSLLEGSTSALEISPWKFELVSCGDAYRVWCVED